MLDIGARLASAPSWAGGFGDLDAGFGRRVEDRLRDLLSRDRQSYARAAPPSVDIMDALAAATLGPGKRIRPRLVLLAFLGAGGRADDPLVVDAGAAVELLHTGCLVHDDIMDMADLRRSEPTMHARFEALHRSAGYAGDPRRFGEGAAILVGNVAFFYAMRLLAPAGVQAQQVFFEMASDVGIGQYLDLLGTACQDPGMVSPAVIASYKTGRYTVEGPMHLGAALAGRLSELAPALTSYGKPLGLAYQLRDDLLGAFGDPQVTGKPSGDDLRQGKYTLLLAFAKRNRDRVDNPGLLDKVGQSELTEAELAALQRLLVRLGARDYVARTCAELGQQAVGAIEGAAIDDKAKAALRAFARYVVGQPLELVPAPR